MFWFWFNFWTIAIANNYWINTSVGNLCLFWFHLQWLRMVPTINLPSQSSCSREEEIGGEYIGEPTPLSGQPASPGGENIWEPPPLSDWVCWGTNPSFRPAGFTFAWLDRLLLNPKGGLLICRRAVWWGLPINLYDLWSLISHPILIMINVPIMDIYSTHNHWPWPLMILVISLVWSETIVISDDGWSSYHICSNFDPPYATWPTP